MKDFVVTISSSWFPTTIAHFLVELIKIKGGKDIIVIWGGSIDKESSGNKKRFYSDGYNSKRGLEDI
jgi:hypothetical protein